MVARTIGRRSEARLAVASACVVLLLALLIAFVSSCGRHRGTPPVPTGGSAPSGNAYAQGSSLAEVFLELEALKTPEELRKRSSHNSSRL